MNMKLVRSMRHKANMRLKASVLAAALILGLVPLLCHAQEFSADVVYGAITKPGAPHETSKLYVSKDQLRLETRGFADTILLVGGEERTTFALYPAQKAYQPLASGPSQYFRVADAEAACPDWQQAADQKIACEKVDHEVVAGRKTVKYQNQGASVAATAAVWVDEALKFVVKWETGTTGAELRNIKEAPQAADLFVVPSGYELLKPHKAKSKGYQQKG